MRSHGGLGGPSWNDATIAAGVSVVGMRRMEISVRRPSGVAAGLVLGLLAAGCVPVIEADVEVTDTGVPVDGSDGETGVGDDDGDLDLDGDPGDLDDLGFDDLDDLGLDDGALAASGSGPSAVVERVVDGDSVEVELDGREVEIRLQNYNAPEKFGFDDNETCNGRASTDALVELAEGALVEVIGSEVDRFGRTLADLAIDGRSVTATLIAGGHGMATRDREDWRDLMKQAAADGRGMWGDRCGIPSRSELIIGETMENPPGPDEDRMEDEWVEVLNIGAEPIELDGWVLRDDTTSHRFPLPGTLDGDAALRVRTGAGRSTPTDLYLDEQWPVWSNSNETVLLVDPSGVVADWVFLDGR